MDDLHIPWTNDALEELLRQIINTGETTKVDFKSLIDLTDTPQQGEVLKDISAMANSYDYSYKNHGFIILGITQNAISGAHFKQTADGLQASIDDLIKKYIEPFIPTQVRIFSEGATAWGVIVIPPTRLAPHAFSKDIHKRYRGDVYVRRGTTTEKAQNSDYIRFFRMHIDEQTFDLRQQLKSQQDEINDIRKELLTKNSSKRISHTKTSGTKNDSPEKNIVTQEKKSQNLLEEIDAAFVTEVDPIKAGLFEEIKKINALLDGQEISWNIHISDKQAGEQILNKIEEISKPFWIALATLIEKDEKGKFEDTIIQVLSLLSRKYQSPNGTYYTDMGIYIRYYPLVVSLYIVFILGTFRKRNTLLKRVKNLQLATRSIYEEATSITYALFYVRRASDIFQTRRADYPHQKWCDAVASCIKALLDQIINIPEFYGDQNQYFFSGEFLLSLTPIDVKDIGHLSSGLYIFMSESQPAISRFLTKEIRWIEKVFDSPMKDILNNFDKNARNISYSGGCIGSGFQGGAEKIAYPENITTTKD
jgi:hypothetical protein